MGDQYYIASDHPLPLIPWDQNAPGFWVGELDEQDDPCVHQRFSKPYVYYIGSGTYDGCEFRLEGEIPEDEEATREVMERLASYLEQAVETGTVELYSGWMNHGTIDPTVHFETVTPDALRQADFAFKDNQLLTIKKR